MRDTLDRDKKVIDEDGAPVPWLTYPCIYYLKQLDFSGRSVFEYGVGSSTEFWSARAKRVISVEHDAIWAGKIRALALPNVEVVCTSGQPYVAACDRAAPHDVIVIDGCWRYDCAATCLRALSSDGMVILDNSERYPAITELLRGAGLIQVDFIGVGPVNRYVWATSIFLTRQVQLKPLEQIQPHHVLGMVDSIDIKPALVAVNQPGSF